jgi:hypothetical protein
MKAKLKALEINNTWIFTYLPLGKKAIGYGVNGLTRLKLNMMEV